MTGRNGRSLARQASRRLALRQQVDRPGDLERRARDHRLLGDLGRPELGRGVDRLVATANSTSARFTWAKSDG